MSKIFKAVAVGMKAALLAMIRLLIALGKLPAALLAAMIAATGGDNDVPEAPVPDERHEEMANLETPSAAPLAQAKQPLADELVAYLANRWGKDSPGDMTPKHWPTTLSHWAASIPQHQCAVILRATSVEVQWHMDGVRSIAGVWPVASWHECRDRDDRAAITDAGHPPSEDLVNEVLDQHEPATVPTVG